MASIFAGGSTYASECEHNGGMPGAQHQHGDFSRGFYNLCWGSLTAVIWLVLALSLDVPNALRLDRNHGTAVGRVVAENLTTGESAVEFSVGGINYRTWKPSWRIPRPPLRVYYDANKPWVAVVDNPRKTLIEGLVISVLWAALAGTFLAATFIDRFSRFLRLIGR
jgi:hypothetical protein